MGLIDGFFDVEGQTRDTIQEFLSDTAEKLNCKPAGFFIMIEAANEEFEPKFTIYQKQVGAPPTKIREVTIAEILGKDEEETE